MRKASLIRRVMVAEVAGFALVLFFIWTDELFDLPHLLFGTGATPINWPESLLETAFVLLLAVVIIYLTRELLRRIKLMEGFVPVCMLCGKVRTEGGWVPMDVYIREHSEADVSHGLCDECATRQYGLEPDGGEFED